MSALGVMDGAELETFNRRRIFSRFDKLDVMFTAFIHFALIAEALRPRLV